VNGVYVGTRVGSRKWRRKRPNVVWHMAEKDELATCAGTVSISKFIATK
jgi:hypothetical protein